MRSLVCSTRVRGIGLGMAFFLGWLGTSAIEAAEGGDSPAEQPREYRVFGKQEILAVRLASEFRHGREYTQYLRPGFGDRWVRVYFEGRCRAEDDAFSLLDTDLRLETAGGGRAYPTRIDRQRGQLVSFERMDFRCEPGICPWIQTSAIFVLDAEDEPETFVVEGRPFDLSRGIKEGHYDKVKKKGACWNTDLRRQQRAAEIQR